MTVAALFAACAIMSAQSISDATKLAREARESLNNKDYATALAGFQNALQLAQECGSKGGQLAAVCKEVIPKIMTESAKESIRKMDYDSALAMLKSAVSTARSYGEAATAAKADSLIPHVLMSKGDDLLEAKDYVAAADVFAKVLERDATDGLAALRYGMSLEQAGFEEDAADAFEQAAANGQEQAAKTFLASHYMKKATEAVKARKMADAIAAAQKSYDYVPSAGALFTIGQASQLMGKNADAVKYYEKYLEAAPEAKNAAQVANTVSELKKLAASSK